EEALIRLWARLRRVEEHVGPPPAPRRPMTVQELKQRVQWWIGAQTYNHGVLDANAAFRPAWSRYHQWWDRELSVRVMTEPLQALWVPRQPAEFEVARREVLQLIIAELRGQPGAEKLLGWLLEALAAAAEHDRQPGLRPAG